MDSDSQTPVLKVRRSPAQWFRKYFLEGCVRDPTKFIEILGQELAGGSHEVDAFLGNSRPILTPEEQFVEKNRKFIAFGVPLVVAQVGLTLFVQNYNNFLSFSTGARH